MAVKHSIHIWTEQVVVVVIMGAQVVVYQVLVGVALTYLLDFLSQVIIMDMVMHLLNICQYLPRYQQLILQV